MEIILLEKIANLGDLGDKVTVKPGYGRNYLVPHGKAVPATAEKYAEFEKRRAELENKATEEVAAAKIRSDELSKLTVTIEQKAGEEGKLFGSVGTQTIAEAVTKAGVLLHKSEIRLPEGTLRHIGEFEIDIQLHTDVTGVLSLKIVPE